MSLVTERSQGLADEAVTTNDYYVYALITEGVVFYVGKGRGPRMRTHGWGSRPGAAADAIRALGQAGQAWQAVRLAGGLDEAEAFRRERDFLNLVDAQPLANIRLNPWLAYLREQRMRRCVACDDFFRSSRRDKRTCSERCRKRRQRAT